MYKSGKNRLFISVVLGVILLIGGGAFITFSSSSSKYQIVIFSVILLLAVGTVIVTVFAMKRTEKRISSLPDDYKTAYIDAGEAVGTSPLKGSDKKEVMEMILEIFSHAAFADRSVDEVTGNDMKNFIEGFIDAAGGRSSGLYYFLYGTMTMFLYMIILKVYLFLKAGGIDFSLAETRTMNLLIIIFFACVSFIVLPWLMILIRKAASEQWTGLKRMMIVLPVAVPLILIALLVAAADSAFIQKIDIPVPMLSTPLSFAGAVIIIVVCGVLMRYTRRSLYHRHS